MMAGSDRRREELERLRRENDYLKYQLRQADKRLAAAEQRAVRLEEENVDAASRASSAQNQLRAMRQSPAWRTTETLLKVEDQARESAGGLVRAARAVKRKVIG